MATDFYAGEYEFHDAANIFPMDEEHIAELAIDIQKNGQLVPIELFEGKILDGRRRYQACLHADIEPKFKKVNPADPVKYVLSLNLHRRHLTPTQLSMVAARVREIYDGEAKERMADGGKAAGKGRPKQGMENLPHPIDSGAARDKAGESVGVSGKSVDHATKVLKSGTEKLIAAVDSDKIAVSTAARVASLSPAEQDALVERAETAPKKARPSAQTIEPDAKPEGERRGIGVIKANEAINCLSRIPKNDALRKRGFQIVTDWIKANK